MGRFAGCTGSGCKRTLEALIETFFKVTIGFKESFKEFFRFLSDFVAKSVPLAFKNDFFRYCRGKKRRKCVLSSFLKKIQ